MATVAELRATLASKGYQQNASNPTQETQAPRITVHTHPLLSSPVVLIGADNTTAIQYQVDLVTQATTRK